MPEPQTPPPPDHPDLLDPSELPPGTILKARAGCPHAFHHIVTAYQGTLTATLYRFTTNRADLEDLLQDTFLRAWKALPTWQPDQPLIHWLRRIATRTALEFCRRHRRSVFSRLVAPAMDSSHPDPLDRSDATTAPPPASALDARAILSLLPPDDRHLLTLQYLEGLSLSEIADRMSWSVPNAKVRAHRARKKLKSILDRHGITLD